MVSNQFLLKIISIALIFAGCSTLSMAYVGEISKDAPADQIEGLAPLTDRHRAYGIIIRWNQRVKSDTPMPTEVLQSYKLLRNSDEQVLMFTHQDFLREKIQKLREKLSISEQNLIDGYTVRISAAFDGVARVRNEDKSILIPVDFLHDAWTAAMALEEAESIEPYPFYELGGYIAARTNPQIRTAHKDQAYLTQGFSLAVNGKSWQVSREKWNDAIWSAYAFTRGAALHEAFHELCHIILHHKNYGEISAQRSKEQELQADACAFKSMKDFPEEFFHPMGALLLLFNRSFDSKGMPITSETHPPSICRFVSLLDTIPQLRDAKSQILELTYSRLPEDLNSKAVAETEKAIKACKD